MCALCARVCYFWSSWSVFTELEMHITSFEDTLKLYLLILWNRYEQYGVTADLNLCCGSENSVTCFSTPKWRVVIDIWKTLNCYIGKSYVEHNNSKCNRRARRWQCPDLKYFHGIFRELLGGKIKTNIQDPALNWRTLEYKTILLLTIRAEKNYRSSYVFWGFYYVLDSRHENVL